MAQSVFDKALELASPGAAVTATASTTGVAIGPRFLPSCDWVIYVKTLPAGTNETYVFTLEVSDLVGGTYTAIATWNWPRGHGVGRINIPINGYESTWQDTDSAFVRVTLTETGTAPSCVYGSFLAKSATGPGLGRKYGDIVTVS